MPPATPDARLRMLMRLVEAAAWLVEYIPKILSYLDPPHSLDELQRDAADPRDGYQVHHIVETQYNSNDPASNWRRFGTRLEAPDNRVSIPYWKHVEISSWYSTKNKDYGGMTPRAYLRGKSWGVQYKVGLRIMRHFGALK